MLNKLSIITINLNNKEGLLKTIDTVNSQTFDNYEHIVVDGASHDGSIDVIKQNKNIRFKWISEKDNGIYNAMNKGISMSSGEYLLFLNSGDYLDSPQVLSYVFEKQHVVDLICCSLKIELLDKRETIIYSIGGERITSSFIFSRTIPHPSTFIRRKLFEKYGLYDESFQIAGDYAFFVNVIRNNASYVILPLILSVFNDQGLSWTNLDTVNAENLRVRKKYYGLSYYSYRLIYNLSVLGRKVIRSFGRIQKAFAF